MIVAYCIRRAGEPGPQAGLTGRGGAAVRLLEAEGLGLWVSEAPGEGATLEEIRAHDSVVRAALRTATPLPVRFDTRFPDDDAARAMLRERREDLREGLERVADRVEVGVRVLWSVPPPARVGRRAASSGREYLEMRRSQLAAEEERRSRAESLLERVELRFAPLELPTVRTLLPEEGVAGTLAHLVHRGNLQEYRIHAEAARRELGDATLSFTGPWAPYSFV